MKRDKPTPEEIRLYALRQAAEPTRDLVAQLVAEFQISRQAAHRYVKALVDEGSLEGKGQTRARVYQLAVLERAEAQMPLAGTEEHEVWRRYARSLMDAVPGPVNELAHFCFTEMVNNAIDHSEGERLLIEIERTALWITMTVMDDGVGIFRKIRNALGLTDDRHSMLELTKGKFTTDPKAHSGLGIFYSSKACNEFGIRSGHIYFTHLRSERDWLMDDLEQDFGGTFVQMRIDLDTDRTLESIFARYSSPENPGFSRTTIPVLVAQYGDENLVSRSQAKRVLARVDRFKEVFFDFEGVTLIGQAFADEIFRVFPQDHPEVRLIAVNTTPQVQAMIDLALAK